MNLPMKNRIDELIDAHGSVHAAIQSRRDCIARRAERGVESPRATEELEMLLNLPLTYLTAAQQARFSRQAQFYGQD